MNTKKLAVVLLCAFVAWVLCAATTGIEARGSELPQPSLGRKSISISYWRGLSMLTLTQTVWSRM